MRRERNVETAFANNEVKKKRVKNRWQARKKQTNSRNTKLIGILWKI